MSNSKRTWSLQKSQIEFSKRWKKGKGTTMEFDEFIEEIKKMVKIKFSEEFKKSFRKISHNEDREKIIKQLRKIHDNPEIGKPMKFSRRGSRELYIKPYRLSYKYYNNTAFIIDLYHKDKQ